MEQVRSITCTMCACCRTGISTTRTPGKNLPAISGPDRRRAGSPAPRQGQLAAIVQVQQVPAVAVLGLGVALQHDPLDRPLGVLVLLGEQVPEPPGLGALVALPASQAGCCRLVWHAGRDAGAAPAAPFDGRHDLAFLGRDHGARVAAVLEGIADPVGEVLGLQQPILASRRALTCPNASAVASLAAAWAAAEAASALRRALAAAAGLAAVFSLSSTLACASLAASALACILFCAFFSCSRQRPVSVSRSSASRWCTRLPCQNASSITTRSGDGMSWLRWLRYRMMAPVCW